jgi:uncharacterized protein YbbC (DUF1343 family)
VFRPAVFEPTFHKHAKASCGGCQLHVTDRQSFRPVLAAVLLLEAFRSANRERFQWRDPPYEYEHVKSPIDILAGSASLREQIDAAVPAEAIARSWDNDVSAFDKIRQRFLAYTAQ